LLNLLKSAALSLLSDIGGENDKDKDKEKDKDRDRDREKEREKDGKESRK
jgi:hypothetical protein